jgi:hypothetical protein
MLLRSLAGNTMGIVMELLKGEARPVCPPCTGHERQGDARSLAPPSPRNFFLTRESSFEVLGFGMAPHFGERPRASPILTMSARASGRHDELAP